MLETEDEGAVTPDELENSSLFVEQLLAKKLLLLLVALGYPGGRARRQKLGAVLASCLLMDV